MPEKPQPRVILVWNAHINESPVTFQMARLLKAELEKRGIAARIVKTPYKKSQSFEFRQNRKPGLDEWFKQPNKEFPHNLAIENSKSLVIDVHCSPIETFRVAFRGEQLGVKTLQPSKHWKAKIMELAPTSLTPLTLSHIQDNEYFIEFPAIMKEAPNALQALKPKPTGKNQPRGARYFERIADLNATKAAQMFTPLVVKKLAHLVEAEAKMRAGIFKKPGGFGRWYESRTRKGSRYYADGDLRMPLKKSSPEHARRRMLKDAFKRRML